MLIILRLSRDASTSTHTNCLIQLLKSVSMGTVGLNRGRAFYSGRSCCQASIQNFFVSAQPLGAANRFNQLGSGRRIIQRQTTLSTPTSPATRFLQRALQLKPEHPTL